MTPKPETTEPPDMWLVDAKNIADFPDNQPTSELLRAYARLARTESAQRSERAIDRLDRRLNTIRRELQRRGGDIGTAGLKLIAAELAAAGNVLANLAKDRK